MMIRTAPRSIRLARVGSAVLALTLVAAGTAVAADRGITMRDFAFAPGTVEIRVGDRVTWTNEDGVEHNARATSGAWDTGLLGTGESGSIRFTAPGRYDFLCTPHPSMTGTVVVRSTAAPATDTVDATPATGAQGDMTLGVLLGALGLGVLAVTTRLGRRASTRDHEHPGA